MNHGHALTRKKSLSFADLAGERLMVMQTGTSPVNDSIRSEILQHYPAINLTDIPPQYNLRTFNRCADSNALSLSLECWNHVHPGLVSVPLAEPYGIPFGIITASGLDADMEEFIATVRKNTEISAT